MSPVRELVSVCFMKTLILFFSIFTITTISMNADASWPLRAKTKPAKVKKPAKLRYEPEFIFQKMLEYKNKAYDSSIPMPKIYVESKTTLKDFQDAIEPQWGFRPDYFTNAYAVAQNTIYLLDDNAYYQRLGRCMDDSLAHELVHFIQAKYQKFDLNDEFLELEAMDYQTKFREEFCK